MTLDQEEKRRLAQLGLDRRLAEAVSALDEEAAIFLRLAGDENAEEAEIMQAASNYRAAVQRRNVAYDKACGIPEGEAGKATVAAPLDEEALRKAVEEWVPKIEPPKATIDGDALRAAVDKASQGAAKPSGTQAKSS
jgi:hypothetical protein